MDVDISQQHQQALTDINGDQLSASLEFFFNLNSDIFFVLSPLTAGFFLVDCRQPFSSRTLIYHSLILHKLSNILL